MEPLFPMRQIFKKIFCLIFSILTNKQFNTTTYDDNDFEIIFYNKNIVDKINGFNNNFNKYQTFLFPTYIGGIWTK